MFVCVCLQPLDSFDGEEQKGLETDEEIEEAFRQMDDSVSKRALILLSC